MSTRLFVASSLVVASALCSAPAWSQGAPQPPPDAQQPLPPPQQPPPGYGQQPPPGYGQQPPPGYGQQPPPGYGPPPPGYGYGPPPPGYGYGPPPVDKTVRNHDGFYLRMGIGIGSGTVKSKGKLLGNDFDVKYTGSGASYELMLGGTLGSGFVLGGGFVGQDISDPKVTVSGTSGTSGTGVASGSLGVVVLGPMFDWFFDPRGGAHVGAMIGSGGIGLSDGNGETSRGLGTSLWGGYDFWVGQQWSMGPELRFVHVSGKRDVLGEKFEDKATSVEVLFTALYH